MKVKNTYSRKKHGKPGSNTQQNVVNVNMVFLSVNILNNNSSETNQTKPESSKSESGDLFDKLVKGPTFNNVNNQSAFSFSNYSKKFFRCRQDTATFYRSDDSLSISSEISNHLFKDSKDSQTYSSAWTPSPYCKVKNKLVKVKKGQKITINKPIHRSNCVQKKHPILRKNKVLKKGKLNQVESVYCISSTPTKSALVSDNDIWVDTHVSPILPASLKKSICYKDFNTCEDQGTNEKVNSVLGMTGLLEGFGNMGIQTPHQKIRETKCHEKELFDYESPKKVPSTILSEVVNQDITPAPCHNSLPVPSEIEDREKLEQKLSLVNDKIENKWCESSKGSLTNCQVSTPKRIRSGLEDDVCTSFESEITSPFLGFEEKSSVALLLSPVVPTTEATNSETISPKQKLSPSNILPSNFKDVIESVLYEENESNSINLGNTSPSSDSNVKHKSDMSDITEKFCNNDDLNLSLEKTENKNKRYSAKFNDCVGSLELDEAENKIKPVKTAGVSQFAEPKPLNDITNLSSVITNSDSIKGIRKQSVPLSKEYNRKMHYSLRDRLSGLPTKCPVIAEVNETFSGISLEAGKKWRRSFLRQKSQEPKIDRRVSLTSDTLFKLIKESSFSSNLANKTNFSCNNTTRAMDSFLEEQESKNSMQVAKGSPGFNITLSRFSNIYVRRRNYIFDMNEIPEEIAEHSNDNLEDTHEPIFNEAKPLQEESVVEQDFLSVCETSVNETNVYETPPILKMNPEALSAITDRKRSRRYQRSLERSLLWDTEEENESNDDESKLYISCSSKLGLEDEIENLKSQDVEEMGKVGFLLQCGQQAPMSFSEAFPERVLSSGLKIGEGVFGEVFMLERPGEGRSVIKIIPIEGTQVVNGAAQKRYAEVLTELIITGELSMLRNNNYNCTAGFCELRNKFYLQGQYPTHLLRLWHDFDHRKRSENECPDMFGPEQLYLALELAHAGEAVDSFSFKTTQQALSVFLQTTFSLAVAESAADFEHRDLHIGNVLVQSTDEKYTSFVLNGTRFECPTFETMATIIDYTLSRVSFRGEVLYLDLEQDPELFTAEGDYQFDIYRDMRADLNHNWRKHNPKTNIRWLHYLIDKLANKIKYKQKKSTKKYKEYMDKIVILKDLVLDYDSASDLALHLVHFNGNTSSLIRNVEDLL